MADIAYLPRRGLREPDESLTIAALLVLCTLTLFLAFSWFAPLRTAPATDTAPALVQGPR